MVLQIVADRDRISSCSYHSGESAVESHEVAPVLSEDELGHEEDGEAGGAAAQDRVDHGAGHGLGVALARDGGLEYRLFENIYQQVYYGLRDKRKRVGSSLFLCFCLLGQVYKKT